MRNYGVPTLLDLTSDGGNAVTVTPGSNPQAVQFLVQAPKAGLDDNWPLCTNIIVATDISIDQPESGASEINGDVLPLVIDSYDVNSPIFGLTHPRDTFTSPIAKHIVEFFCSGYRYSDGMRRQIGISAGGVSFYTNYQVLPFAHELFTKPHHSAIWLGWLNATKVTTYVAGSAALNGVSSGASLGAATVRTWCEFVVSDELIMPTINQWHLYEPPASGGTTSILQGLGTPNGLLDVMDGSRVAALLELTPALGLGGVTDPAGVTSVTIPQFGQDVTVNIDGFFSAFHRVLGAHPEISKNLFPGGDGAATAANVAALQGLTANLTIDDRGGNPYQMATAVGKGPANGFQLQQGLIGSGLTGGYDPSSAGIGIMYIPWRAPGKDSQLTKIKKFWGDLKVIRTFGNSRSAPSSGKYRFVTNELRELGPSKKKELVAKTGKPAKLERIYSSGVPDPRTAHLHPGKRDATLPQRVMFRAGGK